MHKALCNVNYTIKLVDFCGFHISTVNIRGSIQFMYRFVAMQKCAIAHIYNRYTNRHTYTYIYIYVYIFSYMYGNIIINDEWNQYVCMCCSCRHICIYSLLYMYNVHITCVVNSLIRAKSKVKDFCSTACFFGVLDAQFSLVRHC